MHLRISHRTTLTYDGQAHDSFNEVRLRPMDEPTQRCREFELRIVPETGLRDYADFYGNTVHYFEVADRHAELVIEAVSAVETMPTDARSAIPEVPVADLEGWSDRELLAEFYTDCHYVPLTPELWREAQDVVASGAGDVWDRVRRLGHQVHQTCAYRPGTTAVTTLATDVLERRTGVCQDFAHLHLGLCRSMGIPARYVSGYFFNETREPDECEASHAWIEAYVPGHGWAGWDPTHDRLADERYVKIAVGRDYADIRPVNGTYRGAPTRSLAVDVTVRRAP